MGWLYNRNYVGPDRRGKRFEVRFLERRKRQATETRASLPGILRQLFAGGLKWVDAASYFGPDRRSGAFSHFFLERRRRKTAGKPPPLHAALRQLRVRVLDAEKAEGRRVLQERLTATALLAVAQGRPAIGDLLDNLAAKLAAAQDGQNLGAMLQTELLAAEAMLADPVSERV